MEQLIIRIFGQTLLGSVIVLFTVQKLKWWFRHLLYIEGTAITALALIIGGLLGAGAFYFHLAEGSLLKLIIQGIISGFLATGEYDLITKRTPE